MNEYDWLVSLTECPQCEAPILVGQSVEPGLHEAELGPAARLWPEPARQLPAESPDGLRQDFAEAERCFTRGDYTASAIMTRRCLEGLAAEMGAKQRTLAKRIEHLRDDGHINDQLFQWAEALRLVGNDAAHNTATRVARRDAEDVLVFAEALAEYVYSLTKKYDAFMARRSTRSP